MKISLRYKIIFSIVFLILFFGALATLTTFFITQNMLTQVEEEDSLQATVIQAHETSLLFSQSQNVVKAIAQQHNVVSYVQQATEMDEAHIVEHRLLHDFNIGNAYSAIYIMDSEGNTLVSTDESFVGKNYSFRDYFQYAKQGEPFVDVAVGATSGELGYYFSHPITNSQGTVVGVAVVKLIPSFVHDTLFDTKTDGTVMIVDQYGVIIFSTDSEKIFHSLAPLESEVIESDSFKKRFPSKEIMPLDYEEVYAVLQNYSQPVHILVDDEVDNEKELLNIVNMENSPFYLINERNIKNISRTALQQSLVIALFVVGAAATAAIVITIVVTKFLQPLSHLQRMAEHISEGKYDKIVQLHTQDELEELSDIFIMMAKKVKKSQSALQQEIDKKTKNLQEKINQLEKMNEVMVNRELKMKKLKEKLKENT